MTNDKIRKKAFDLEERTSIFGEKTIELCKDCSKNIVTIPIINQLIRSATSIGANYCEANGASSRRDFKNKIFICKKEAKETMYWFRMLSKALGSEELRLRCKVLWQESRELSMIFATIAMNTQ